MSAHINVVSADPAVVGHLAENLEVPSFIATILASRGIDTPKQAREFLAPSLDRDWRNPCDIEGMDEVVDALVEAIREDKRLLVFGDFDLDGISATATMTRGLRELGAEVIPFIPLRFEEGYGLTEAALERVMTYEPDLVITVDNGIAAAEEAQILARAGVDLIITDHHEPSGSVPQGIPLVDPKCSSSPSAILSGAGVALKVVQATGARFGRPHLWRDFIDLATLGTVADLMPMIDENRALVSKGVAVMNESPRTCIAALLAESGFADKPITATNLSFTLVPRLNAAGRMGNAQLALDLLMCDDFTEALRLAGELEKTNTSRRRIEAELAQVAEEKAQEVYHGQRALVVAGENWHEGVKGIVASRLTNRYGVPSILFTIDGDEARGSGRSVGEINLFKAVESCKDILVRFGGHGAAVGVTVKTDKLAEFNDRLCAYMDALPAESFHPRIRVDALIDLSELTRENVEKLDLLAPFGQENPMPKFLAHSVMISRARAVGADKNHLSCTLTDGSHSLAGIMFHCAEVTDLLACSSVVDAVFELQIDTWRGKRSVKAVISSLAPVEPCVALEACLEGDSRDFISDLIDRDEMCFEGECFDSATVQSAPDRRGRFSQPGESPDPEALRADLIEAFIPGGSLHPSQVEILDSLDRGESVLGVMGTGRGKSLIFSLHAAEIALIRHEMSLFVYPLRALIADQAFHLRRALEPFGVTVQVLTGELSQDERARAAQAMEAGEVDIVLTTPEYLTIHLDEFTRRGSWGFVTVDEAHHVALSRAGYRQAYTRLGETLAALGDPPVLALTATAAGGVARQIKDALFLDGQVFDETARPNLLIDDRRNIRKRDRYLANLVSQGEKTLIYVNSRMESLVLARELRHQVPQVASLIGFYNAGLTREERDRVEALFRSDDIQILVATSAFGEGIDIPGIRHVVLYHLPFSEVEFNQMSGRAGRDGKPCWIHLLFGKSDADINRSILNEATPHHDDMAQVYRRLRSDQRQQGSGYFPLDEQQLASRASKTHPPFTISPSQARCAVAVFEELGLVEIRREVVNDVVREQIHVVDYEGKVELTDSVRYREGTDEIEAFAHFLEWVLHQSADSLQDRIQKPLLPNEAKGD